jgi:H+-transporting ATPase
VTLAILLFNFFPVTAIMIVLLALLNDGSILSIAYDNVQYKDQPEAWNMRLVLGIASVLGGVGPIAAFGLFYLGDKVIDLSRPQLQTMMYLMLSVAGSMTIYLTRTRGPFWSIRPARKLMIAVTGAQIIATVISVGGIFVTALPWKYALLVWGYALAWFLVTDRVKLLAYRILDPDTSATATATSSTAPDEAIDSGAVGAYHTTSPEYSPSHRAVYHIDDACPYGKEITAAHRHDGTAGRALCTQCAEQQHRLARDPSRGDDPSPTEERHVSK